MSTSAVSSSSLNQQLTQYFQTRHTDLSQLKQALGSGDLDAAQTAYNNIVSLGQNGPFPNGEPFLVNQREQDFNAIGSALQNGDLAGAQQAFGALGSTFAPKATTPVNSVPAQGTGGAQAGGPVPAQPEIVLNLSGATGTNPEQITINIGNSGSGGEQVSLSVGNQGSNNAQEITFNLGANSNEQIVLNLLGATSASSSTTGSGASASTTGSGLSVSA
jgi:hypothetical protein